MSSLILIRHPATSMAGCFCGHADPDLDAAGEQQVGDILERIRDFPIQRLYSSDLRRARKLAEAIAAERGLTVEVDSALREIHFGDWEGLLWAEIEDRFPKAAGEWMRDFPARPAPGGEDYREFELRVSDALNAIIRQPALVPVAVVTHRGVMHYALTHLFSVSDPEAWQQTAQYGAVVVRSVEGCR